MSTDIVYGLFQYLNEVIIAGMHAVNDGGKMEVAGQGGKDQIRKSAKYMEK